MAFRRRTMRMRRRPFIRRKRFIRKRRSTFKRQGRKRFSDVYHTFASQTSSIIMPADGNTTFTMSVFATLVDYFTGFETVFRQGRINKIIVKFMPSINQTVFTSAAATLANSHLHFMRSAIDHAGIKDFTVDDLSRYTTYRETMFTRPWTRKFIPSLETLIQDVGAEGASTTSYTPNYKKWLPMNTNSTKLKHGQLLMSMNNSEDIKGKHVGNINVKVFASFKEKF